MITNEDLLKEISFEALTQLSDLNASGFIDQGVIDDALADATALVELYIKEMPIVPSPLLKKLLAELTVTELKRKNALPIDKEQYQRLDKILAMLAKDPSAADANKEPTTTKNTQFAFRQRKRIYDDRN